jgi:hypothetical protein
MQLEMEEGGKLFFDLFVAMCNHMVCATHSLCTHLALTFIRMIWVPSHGRLSLARW